MTNIDDDPNSPFAHLAPEIAEEIENATQGTWLNWFSSLIPFGIMTGGFAVGGLWVWPNLDATIETRVLQIAMQKEAWFYEYFFGFSLLVLLFAWIMLSWMIPMACASLMPPRWKSQYAISLLTDDNSGKSGKKSLLKAINEADMMTSTADIANAAVAIYLRSAARFVLPLLALSMLLLLLEFRSYDLYTEKGLERNPFMPWQTETLYAWKDVESVALGCNQTDDGSSLVYEPKWPEGPSPRITEISLVGERNRLDTLEEIDKILVEKNATFKRWKWHNRNPLHPKCLATFRAAFGPDNAPRVDKLLRVGNFPGDRIGNDL